MFVKILLPTDVSPSSEAAMRLAREHVPDAEHFMNGSVAERVVRLARGPVLITHESRP